MEKQIVNYEIAKILKELGFDELCFMGYDSCETLFLSNERGFRVHVINAPLYQQVIDWAREKYNINIEVNYMPNIKMYCIIVSPMDYVPKEHSNTVNYNRAIIVTCNNVKFESYYDARKQAIIEFIKLIKK